MLKMCPKEVEYDETNTVTYFKKTTCNILSLTNQDDYGLQVDLQVKSEVQSSAKPGTESSEPKKACEQGSEQEIWPVVVEYLNQPGQILVEVLCNDYGLFLEIANIIRHLELTILKGVLESRSNELWAHFVVEVSRGFHRMHILWPLMQLLQRNYVPVPRKL